MIRSITVMICMAICLAQSGCSYKTRTPQYSVAVYSDTNDHAALRMVVERYAMSHGYAEKKSTSIQEELMKQGIVLWSFNAADNSFISLTNAVVIDCYDLGIYSEKDPVAARTVAQEITALLERDLPSLRIDTGGTPCSRK